MNIKYLFLTLFFISPVCLSFYNNIMNPKNCSFTDMQQFYVDELGIKGVRVKHVQENMEDPKVQGYTRRLKTGVYLIAMAKNLEPSEVRITLAHELVHVRQLENGQIQQKEFKKHYQERSFEDEAFRLSLPLAGKFYTRMDCSKE